MSKIEQYEQEKKQIVAKDYADYEQAIRKIINQLKL
jgi:hypothetical protein